CWARKNEMETVIVSGDKDFAQLIDGTTIMWDTMKDVRYDIPGVVEKWGVRPDQMIEYLSLIGDSSDNIPGIPGVGPKTAQKVLAEYDNIENIYKNLDKVKPPSLKEKLTQFADQVELSKRLVTICQDVELPLSHKALEIQPWKTEELRVLFERLNFKAFLKVLIDESPKAKSSDSKAADSKTGDSKTGGSRANSSSSNSATGLTADGSEANSAEMTEGYSEIHAQSDAPIANENEVVKEISIGGLKDIFKDGDEVWIKFENNQLSFHKSHTYKFEGEPMEFMEWSVKHNLRWSGFDLKKTWRQIIQDAPPLWTSKKDYQKNFLPAMGQDVALLYYVFRSKEIKSWMQVYEDFAQRAWPLNANPSMYFSEMQNMYEAIWSQIKEYPIGKVYSEIEKPIAPILLSMELLGIKIDRSFLKTYSDELRTDIAKVEKKVHDLAGENFNIGSPKQLGVILFEKMKLPTGKKTKTGFSTDNEQLEKTEHPIAKEVLEFRELSKLKSTYVDSLPELADSQDRIHTHFNQLLTATGRLSSNNPNLQNIPIRTPRGQRVRKAFIASEGKKLLSVDYSQIELRILAQITKDPGLVRAFLDDLDIHTATAAEVFGIPLKDVSSEQRRKAKAVNFGIAYGQGAFGLAEVLRGEAQEIIKNYFHKFQGVQEYIQSTISSAEKSGYVETLFGRRRYVPEIQNKNGAIKKIGERAAINAPIQGTASDLVKMAMIKVYNETTLPMSLQVHDELIFEATEGEIKEQVPKVVKIMENIVKWDIPLKVNWSTGNNWDDAH
ncbi:MAG: DNA polymerase I, partial [Bdellovibrionota bacterium]